MCECVVGVVGLKREKKHARVCRGSDDSGDDGGTHTPLDRIAAAFDCPEGDLSVSFQLSAHLRKDSADTAPGSELVSPLELLPKVDPEGVAQT